MKTIMTMWGELNYEAVEPTDYTSLFSEKLDEGWEIETISTAVDSFRGRRIIVVTALLSK